MVCRHPQCARIDFLLASGGSGKAIAQQFGLSQPSVWRHYRTHVSDRYKKIIGATRLETFEALMTRATEDDAETLDILNLLIRGHSQQWAIAMESGAAWDMIQHSSKIITALELRSKITRELVPAQSLTVNNYLMRDAAQIVDILRDHPDAITQLLKWHEWRAGMPKAIEHAKAAD
jgi:hypothetical protein